MEQRMWLSASLVVLLGVGVALTPFALPALDSDLGMGGVPAWEWTEARAVRHVAPAGAIVVGGLLLLAARRWLRVVGGLLAAAGGVWVTIAPVVLGKVTAEELPATVDVVRRLSHHFGAGALVVLVAGFLLGRLWQSWRRDRTPLPLPSAPAWESQRQSAPEPVERRPVG